MNRNAWTIIIVAIMLISIIVFIGNDPLARVNDPLARLSVHAITIQPYQTCLQSYPEAFDFCAAKTEGGNK